MARFFLVMEIFFQTKLNENGKKGQKEIPLYSMHKKWRNVMCKMHSECINNIILIFLVNEIISA